MKKTITGDIDVNGSDLYIAPIDAKRNASIESMRFTCNVDYTLEVYKHYLKTGEKDLIYKLNLKAGDVVTDTFPYVLNLNEALFVLGSVPNINYSISLSENVYPNY